LQTLLHLCQLALVQTSTERASTCRAEIAQSDAAWQPRLPAADCAALRESGDVLRALPLRRLFPLLLPSNLLRNSLLQKDAQMPPSRSAMITGPWQITMHRGQGWEWRANGGDGIEATNALPPVPLLALGETPPPPGDSCWPQGFGQSVLLNSTLQQPHCIYEAVRVC